MTQTGTHDIETAFLVAAWEMTRRAGTGLTDPEVIQTHARSREALQNAGYGEGELNVLEAQYIGARLHQREVVVFQW